MSLIITKINIKANDLNINYGIPNPTASPKGGIYKTSQNITLKAISRANILYNTDKSAEYKSYNDTEPITINNSSILNFYAVYNDIKSKIVTENYTILSPLISYPKEDTYSVPQNIILKAFSDDAIIYYSTNNLDIQQYKGSINISNNDTITAFYLYNGVKSKNTVFNYIISEFGNYYKIHGQSSFSISSNFKGESVYGQQYFTKIFNLNRLQYNFRIGLYSGFFTKEKMLNNIKSNPTLLDKENFLKSHMKCIYWDKGQTLFKPTDIEINDWKNNFCLYKGINGSPCRCYDIFPDACSGSYPAEKNYSSLDEALNTVLSGKTAYLSQSIEGGPLISPISTPSITNLPNYIYGITNNYYNNINNISYWANNGTNYVNDINNFGFCLLSNKIITLPCGIVFDDSNKGDNYLGLVNYSIDLINNIKETTKALTHTYYINSQNYKGYTNCILPSFFTLDDKYGFDNNDTIQYKPIEGNRGYNMEVNTFSGKEYKGILKIPKLFMPKGNDIKLLRDVYAMNNNLYNTNNTNNTDTYYTNNSSGSYYIPFNYNGIPFDAIYSIYNKGNSALLKWENSKQEISEYWKLNDKGDKYIAADISEVDQNLINYEFPKYNLPFNYNKSYDYTEFTKSISVNINDIFGRNIKISYQWVRFIDQITIRKYKENLLKSNTKADVDTYLNNLQIKIENFHKENPPESSFYPTTDLKSDQLVKLLDVQLVIPPSEFSYGYVPEVFEMIYT